MNTYFFSDVAQIISMPISFLSLLLASTKVLNNLLCIFVEDEF